MQPYAIRYDPRASPATGHTEAYKLLEVSPDLARAIEQAERDGRPGVRLTIKGTPSDDAVICTDAQTYTLRTITVSNSILCLRPAPSASGTTEADLLLQDTCHEILELTPTAPRLARIEKLLKPTAWRGMGKRPRRDDEDEDGAGTRNVKKRYTRAQMASIVQSSDVELDAGLRERNVITIDDHLMHLPTRPLGDLLGTMLSLATVHAPEPGTKRGTPSGPIVTALEREYDVPPDVTKEVMRLHGHLSTVQEDDEAWFPDVERMVRGIGKALLHLESTIDPPSVDTFMGKWRDAVGAHADTVALPLLEGEHLLTPSSGPNRPTLITPFSASTLPLDPAARFADLFLTRPRWSPAQMEPFLKGLTPEGDRKALERLVVKYVRVVKEPRGGVWWYARR